ncbi:MAG: hypothetical protein U1E51_02870 [Candidatus Binatia bacterium]|nr:hypothetical protein [Candidatus Binatia bacterium]
MPDHVDILKAAPAMPFGPIQRAPGYPLDVELDGGVSAKIDVLQCNPNATYHVYVEFGGLSTEVMDVGLQLTSVATDTLTSALIVASATAAALNMIGA